MCNMYLQDRRAGAHAALARGDAAARDEGARHPGDGVLRQHPRPVLRLWRSRRARGLRPGDAHPASRPPGRRLAAGGDRHPGRGAGPAGIRPAGGGRRRRSGAAARPQLDRAAVPPPGRPDRGPRTAAPSTPPCRIIASWTRCWRPKERTHDRSRRAEARPGGAAGHRRPGAGEAEEPGFLLVLAGAEAAAGACHRRPRRVADLGGRGGAGAEGGLCPWRAGDAARRRHRQLRPGHAAVRRHGAEPGADEPGHRHPPRRGGGRGRRRAGPDGRADPGQGRAGDAAVPVDLPDGDDRRLPGRRLRRRRLDPLGRPAQPRQRHAGAAGDDGGGAAHPRPDRRGPAEGAARLRHQRHHHRGRDPADRGAGVGRRRRRLRRLDGRGALRRGDRPGRRPAGEGDRAGRRPGAARVFPQAPQIRPPATSRWCC